jgi:hypothetical protein
MDCICNFNAQVWRCFINIFLIEVIESKDNKKDQRMCQHCLKKITKKHLRRHEAKCAAANIRLPQGYRVEKQKHLTYTCPCGYANRRSRTFNHIARYHSVAVKLEPSDRPEQHDEPHVKLENENENQQSMNQIPTVDSSMFQYLVFALRQIEYEHEILHQKIGAMLAYIRQ